MGVYGVILGVILGLYGDNKEDGNCYIIGCSV